MRARMIAASLLLASCVAPAGTSVGFSATVTDAPPPPPVAVVDPAGVVIEGGVYVVTDPAVRHDLYRYGGAWYLHSSGFWYRAARPAGPFVVVEARRVPRPVLTVPAGRWRHDRDRHDRGRHDHDDEGHS